MKNLEIRNKFHLLVRWGLGIHGIIHLTEFVLNIVEQAWASAFFYSSCRPSDVVRGSN